MRRRASAAACAVWALLPAAASADPVSAPAAIDVDRWTASATGWWAGMDDARVVGLGHLAVGVTMSYVHDPIVLSGAGGGLGAPVSDRQTFGIAAAYGVTDSVELRLVLPLVIQSGGRLTEAGDPAPLQQVVSADVQAGGKISLVSRRGLDVALAAGVVLPTGNEAHFAGDEGWLADVRGLGGYTRGRLGLGAMAGVRIRSTEVALSPQQIVGNELLGAIAVSYALPAIPRLTCDWTQLRAIVELDGVLGDDVGDKRGPSPLELRAGVRGRAWRGWTVGVTMGRGLVDEVGAPAFRLAVDVAWRDAPRTEPAPRPVLLDLEE
jgi:hypothetical protein